MEKEGIQKASRTCKRVIGFKRKPSLSDISLVMNLSISDFIYVLDWKKCGLFYNLKLQIHISQNLKDFLAESRTIVAFYEEIAKVASPWWSFNY